MCAKSTMFCMVSSKFPELSWINLVLFLSLSDFIAARHIPTYSNLFIYKSQSRILVLLLYVDDIVVTAYNPPQITWLITQLVTDFFTKGLGFLHHVFASEVHWVTSLYLSQSRYAMDLLGRVSMDYSKPISTPVPSKGHILSSSSESYPDPTY